MAVFDRKLSVLLLVIVCYLISVAYCAKKPVEEPEARKEDIPFIKCQVCEKFASQLYHQIQAKRDKILHKEKPQMKEIAENVCDLKKRESDWILKIDVVEQGDRLELVEQDSKGQCNSECKTIEEACRQVSRSYKIDDAEFVNQDKPQLENLTSFICKTLTGACSINPPPVPKDRTPGEPFVPKYDLKERLRRGVVDAGVKLKGCAVKFSNKMKRLWGSKQSSKSGKAEL